VNKLTKRQKPARELLHEALNEQTVKVVRDGCEAIDQLAGQAGRRLRKAGIAVSDDLACALADATKKFLLSRISK
jgi:hypothetical protein